MDDGVFRRLGNSDIPSANRVERDGVLMIYYYMVNTRLPLSTQEVFPNE
jgi:hypothetical protein